MKNKIILPILTAALIMSGCKNNEEKILPEDNPANHGSSPIMETENGFYSNYGYAFGYTLYLRFYERGSDKQVFLCARPECPHDGGAMCTATKKNMRCINTILYDGWIYVLAIEENDETVSYNLYKAALDGTSLTKVGTAFSVNNSSDEEYDFMDVKFIIHKGYAYIPYHLTFGASQFGFAGSGLVKMNISDGSAETIFTGENYFSSYPINLQGSGDYVYYNTSGKADSGMFGYNVESGEITKLLDTWYTAAGKNKYYTHTNFKGVDEIAAYDKETGEKTIICSYTAKYTDCLLPYEDKIIAGIDGNIYVYSENGELLAEADNFYRCEEFGESSLKISGDKLYTITESAEQAEDIYSDIYSYEVYSCPIEDIISGNVEKVLEYKVKNFWITEKEFGRDFP